MVKIVKWQITSLQATDLLITHHIIIYDVIADSSLVPLFVLFSSVSKVIKFKCTITRVGIPFHMVVIVVSLCY